MTSTQLAVVRSLFVTGALGLVAGIILFAIDHSTVEQVCVTGYNICRDEPQSNRGAWMAGVALLALVGTAIAWSTLTPKQDRSEQRPKSSGPSGRGLAIVIGVLFLIAVAGAAIDIIGG